MARTTLVWFRNDLRVHDHEALHYAATHSDIVLPVYCFDPRSFGEGMFGLPKTGPVRARFLRESVMDLRDRLRSLGTDLVVRQGRPETVLPALVRETDATEVCLFEDIGTEEKAVEDAVEHALTDTGAHPSYFWGKTLYHLDDLPFDDASDVPDVFTPFRKRCQKQCSVRSTVPTPDALPPLPPSLDSGTIPTLQDLGYDDDGSVDERSVLPFVGGETRALKRMREYIWENDRLKVYKKTRNGLLGADYSSKLSPWLAHGCLSPRAIYDEVKRYEDQRVSNQSTYWLIFELIWRDFFTFAAWKAGETLFHPGGPAQRDKPWRDHPPSFDRWAAGTTGIPFVDANMRELNRTGFMSNRGRQNVASMLSQSLAQDWRKGAAYFEATLVDYDVASNWGNWAYNSGVGHDPRDRYFNIVKQAKRYDSDGDYVRHWLPELDTVPDRYIHEPHRMSRHEQEAAGCILGADYPQPLVDLEETYARIRRER